VKTSSAKAKGRRLQNRVAADLRYIGTESGLEVEDVKPVSMGVSGVDVLLTPAARRLFDLIIECKNHQKLNVVGVFTAHAEKYKDKSGLKLLVHSRNRSEDLVTMRWVDFTRILASQLAGVGFPFTHSSSTTKGHEHGNIRLEGQVEAITTGEVSN